MDWTQLTRYFQKTYDFLENIDANNAPDFPGVPLPPLIKLSSAIALQTIAYNSHKSRLVLLFPERSNLAVWLSILCTLEVMKNDYFSHPSSMEDFTKGQKLLVDRCVVEFDKREFRQRTKQWVIRVRCKGDDYYSIPFDKKLVFQPTVSKKPLSSMQKVCRAYYSAPILDNPIDRLLGIRTLGNKTFFTENLILVSQIGETKHFLSEHYINKHRLLNLFLWGRIGEDGAVNPIGSELIEAEPSCLVSPNFFGIPDYLNTHSGKTKGIIVDGVAKCVKDPQLFDEILDTHIPLIVLADMLDTNSLSFLSDRNFKIWHWNKDNIPYNRKLPLSTKTTVFAPIHRKLHNYCHQKIDKNVYREPLFDDIYGRIQQLNRHISADIPQIQTTISQLFYLFNGISRLIFRPDLYWNERLKERILKLKSLLQKQRMYLSNEALQLSSSIVDDLLKLLEQGLLENNQKVQSLEQLFRNLSEEEKLIVALPDKQDIVEYSKQYWEGILPAEKLQNVDFHAVSDLWGNNNLQETFQVDHVVVCGWLNGKKMEKLLYSYITPHITLLLYSFEASWFKFAQKRWRKQHSYRIKTHEFSELLPFSEAELDSLNGLPQESEEPDETGAQVEQDDFNIFEFEQKIRSYQYSKYKSSESSWEEVSKAKLVMFDNNTFSFLTETYHLPVITTLIKGKKNSQEIPRRVVDELKIGDYVLFRDIDSDIIREISDRALEEQGRKDLNNIAALWQDALRDKYQAFHRNFHKLFESLEKAGCTRCSVTVRNWLFNDSRIGPQSEDDIRIIAEATGHWQLKKKLPEVWEAISTIRGLHLRASHYVTQKLMRILPELIEGEKSQMLDLEEYGQVYILKIHGIAEHWEIVKTTSVNQLLSEEDE